jgi:hypothetical protein
VGERERRGGGVCLGFDGALCMLCSFGGLCF